MLKQRITNTTLVHYHTSDQMIMWQDEFDLISAEPPGVHVKANRTVTLALPKIGPISLAAGEIVLADIGIPTTTFERAGFPYLSPFGADVMIPLYRTTSGG